MSSIPIEQRRAGGHGRGGHEHSREERLGPYRLVQRLGEGGMGVVHLGLDERGRAVAIKVLRDHVAHDPVARARLAREVATLRRVRHPRVAPVLAAAPDGPRPYVVTRYVPGDPLDVWVAQHGPMDPAGLARLGRGLVEALGAIHAAGVVHRDLKPANVLINQGDPVVIDFGIAHVADEARLTHTGLVMGTPGYLAPELLDGHPVDDATDWWAWAATLLFAATGRPPFGTGPVDAILHRVRRGEADLTGVDARLRPVLLAGLRSDARSRPRQEDILAALDVFAAGGDTAAIVGGAPAGGTDSALASDQSFGESTRPVAPPRRGLADTVAHPAAALGAAFASARAGLRPSASPEPGGSPEGVSPGAVSPGAVSSGAVSAPATLPSAASSWGASSGSASSAGVSGSGDAQTPATRPQPVAGTRILPSVDPRASHEGAGSRPVGRPDGLTQHPYADFRGPHEAQARPAPATASPAAPERAAPGRSRWWGRQGTSSSAQFGGAPPAGRQSERHAAAPRAAQPSRPYGAPQFGSPLRRGGGPAVGYTGGPAAGSPVGSGGGYGYGDGRPAAYGASALAGPRWRHSVQLPLLALLAALCGLAMSYPVMAVLVAAAWSVLARTVEASSLAIFAGAAERGPRRSDAPIAVLMAPFRALPALLTTLLVLIVSGVLAAGAAFGAAAVLTEATGLAMTVESEPVLAIALAVGVLVGWWGPAGATLRRGSRRTMRALTMGRLGALAMTVVLALVGAYFAIRSQASGVSPDWYPWAGALLRDLLPPF